MEKDTQASFSCSGLEASSFAKRSSNSLQAMAFEDFPPPGGTEVGGGDTAGASSGGAGLTGGNVAALFRTPNLMERNGTGASTSFISKLTNLAGGKKRPGASATGVALKQSATDSSLNSSCGPCHHQMRKRFDDSPHGSLITHSKSKRELMRNSQVGGGLPASVSSFEHNSDVFPENHDHSEANSPSTSLAPLRVVDGLGQGGFACVVQVESTEDKTSQFAMKVIPKHKATRRRDRARLKAELFVMTHMPPSPFLQRCHLGFESSTDLFFVLDLASGGDLFYHLIARIRRSGGGFSDAESRRLLAEVVVGLAHLHAHGFVHRDIKVENIMLDARGHVKLVDFGLACALTAEEGPMSPTGSLIYMAPELLSHSRGGRHTDWWAVGVLAHELLTGRTPWSSLTDKEVIRREIKTLRVAPPRRMSASAGALVCSLLTHDRRKRLGTRADADLQKARFFDGVDWNAVASQQCPPALTVGADCVARRDRETALAAYRARTAAHTEAAELGAESAAMPSPPPLPREECVEGRNSAQSSKDYDSNGNHNSKEPWYFGLPVVAEHPEISSHTASSIKKASYTNKAA